MIKQRWTRLSVLTIQRVVQGVIGIAIAQALFSPLHAADEIGKQLHFDVNPQWYNKGNIKVFGQIALQKAFVNNSWWRYVVKPSVAYALGYK